MPSARSSPNWGADPGRIDREWEAMTKKPYTERPPVFADEYGTVVFVAEGTVSSLFPWEGIIPERFSASLVGEGVSLHLETLGYRDTLDLVSYCASYESSLSSVLLNTQSEMELGWVIRNSLKARDGLRELVMHLGAAGKQIVFVSTVCQKAAELMVQLGLKLPTDQRVFGRRPEVVPQGRCEALREPLERSVTRSPDGLLVVADASVSLPESVQGVSDVLRVGNASISASSGNHEILDLALQCDLTVAESQSLQGSRVRRDRVNLLKSRENLTDAEMREYSTLTGGLRVFSNSEKYGFIDVGKGMENIALLRSARIDAAKNNHLLEVIAIDAVLLEVELRNWLIIHKDSTFRPSEKSTFGQLVSRVEGQGFLKGLVDRLRVFLSIRNDAIHNLAIGSASYFELMTSYMSDCSLLFDVQDFVYESLPRWPRA